MSMLLSILVVLVLLSLLVLCCFAVFLVYRRQQFAHIPGPPIKSFFMGHVDEMKQCTLTGQAVTDELFLEWHKMYGRLICVWFIHQPLLSVCDPELVKHLLITKDYPKGKIGYEALVNTFGERSLGRGLFTEKDEKKWSRDRKVLSPAFHRQFLKDMMEGFNASADLLIEKFLKRADGKTEVFMHTEFAKLALDVICKVGFGMEVDLINDTSNQFPDAVTKIMEGFLLTSFHPYAQFDPRCWSKIDQFKSAVRFVRETGRKVIKFRQLAINQGEQVPNDILQHILALPGRNMEEMLDNFLTLFIAGHETTAGMMSFCVLELTQHPDVLERLVEENSQVLCGRKCVEFDDLAKLQQLGNTLKETLRLYPTAPATLRDVRQGDMLGDVTLPIETPVRISSYVMGRFPEYWANAEDFNPARFEDPEQASRSHFTMFPFSLGPHNCLGQHFAQIEAKVALSRLLQTFKFKLAPGQNPKKIRDFVTLRPHDGAVCYLEKREQIN